MTQYESEVLMKLVESVAEVKTLLQDHLKAHGFVSNALKYVLTTALTIMGTYIAMKKLGG